MTTDTPTTKHTHIHDRWADALESGTYKQGRNALCAKEAGNDGEFKWCCLGVGCDLVAPEGWRRELFGRFRVHVLGCKGTEQTGLPSEAVMDRLEITGQQTHLLAGMNDQGKTFDEIAAVIRNFRRKGTPST